METSNDGVNPEQESFLEDVFDTREYDKKVKSAQTTIFIVGAIQLIVGVFMAFSGSAEIMNFQIGLAVFISAIFFGLGIWCKTKPYTAIIIALCVYVALLLPDIFFDPSLIVKGIIVKIFIIGYLVKGITAAKAANDLKNM